MAPAAAYGITFNNTTRHYIREDSNFKTLCGRKAAFPISDATDTDGILDGRPLCERCEACAVKRPYLAADRIDWTDPDRKLLALS